MVETKIIKALAEHCSVLSTVCQEEDEAAWLAARTRGIGGSDVGTIMGVNPWSSPRLIYLSKTGQYEDAANRASAASLDAMRFGHLLEPIVANEFAHRTGLNVVNVNATFSRNSDPWQLANIDRFIVDDDGKPVALLECKTAHEFKDDDWSEGELPMQYIYQLNWYMGITGIHEGHFACLVGGNKFHHYPVFFSEELFEMSYEKCKDFWFNNVLKLVEPELDGSMASTDFVKEKYDAASVVKGSEIVLNDPTLDDLIETIKEGKKQLKELEAIVDAASNRLKEKIGLYEIGITPGHVVKWSPQSQRRIDTERLKREVPHIFEQYCKTISFRKMTIK